MSAGDKLHSCSHSSWFGRGLSVPVWSQNRRRRKTLVNALVPSADVGNPKPRRSRTELRDLVISAGRDVLSEIEPTLGFEQLNYARVFDHLESTQGIRVTHASVHERIWPNQQAFQFDVLRASLEGLREEAWGTFAGPMADAMDEADFASLEGRRNAARTLVRIGQNANWDAVTLSERSQLRAYQMLHFSLAPFDRETLTRERADLYEFMGELRDTAMRRYVSLMQGMADLCGLRTMPDLGDPAEAVDEIARAAHLMAIGFMLDHMAAPDLMRQVPTGPDGEIEEWRPVSLAIWNYLRGVFELDGEGLTAEQRRL